MNGDVWELSSDGTTTTSRLLYRAGTPDPYPWTSGASPDRHSIAPRLGGKS